MKWQQPKQQVINCSTLYVYKFNCLIQILFSFNMAQVKIETVETNTAAILEKVGKDSFVNWDQFSQSSSDVARSIDQLNTALGHFREAQHKSFIQTMKKLKSLDIPDLLQAVQSKKLPKEALRGVVGRFKFENGSLELAESKESLQQTAKKEFDSYVQKNKEFTDVLNSYIEFINKKAEESGYSPLQETKQEQTEGALASTNKFNLSDELATKIASEIKIQYLANTQFIGFETYSQIVEGTFKLIKSDYEKLTREARKNQRENIKNPKQYLNILNEYLMNGEALINEGQATLARKVGISEDKFGQSEMALMDRGLGNNMLMIQSQLRAKIKQSLQSEKDVSLEVAKEIIKYQVELIDKRSKDINAILSGLDKGPEVIQMVPMLLALILNDYVFEKYGYEEQDFMKNLTEDVITKNTEFMNIFRSMEMGIMKLMQQLDVIPPEVANLMKQQQTFMETQGMMPGMMPPGMGAGMGPGTNPMDMLQMQQMEQMQAMFAQMGLQPPK